MLFENTSWSMGTWASHTFSLCFSEHLPTIISKKGESINSYLLVLYLILFSAFKIIFYTFLITFDILYCNEVGIFLQYRYV